jgi:hypothetical protein
VIFPAMSRLDFAVGVSKATATRELQDLVKMAALTPIGGGRSASYRLNPPSGRTGF